MGNKNILIETERLYLRESTLEDAPLLLELHADPEVQKYTGEPTVNDLETIKRLFKERTLHDYQTYGYGRWAVFQKSDDAFIGWSGLKYLPEFDLVDLGYRFHVKYWGKGYATESAKAILEFGFKTLNLEKIVAIAEPENPASIRVMEKSGMLFWKNAPYDEGGPDAIWYEITNTDYADQ